MKELQDLIQTALLQAVSASTSNVFDYLVATTQSFQNEMLVTYELINTSNVNTFEVRNAIREFEITVRISSPTIGQILSNVVFIIERILALSGGNVGYMNLVNEDQPSFDVQKQLYTSAITFQTQWIK